MTRIMKASPAILAIIPDTPSFLQQILKGWQTTIDHLFSCVPKPTGHLVNRNVCLKELPEAHLEQPDPPKENELASLKTQTSLKSICSEESENELAKHPASKYLRGTKPSIMEFKKFVKCLHQGLNYSVHNLRGPSEQFLKSKSVTVTERPDAKMKFLILDLDETLVHCDAKGEIAITPRLNFNIRPHCFEFLEKMSEHFQIYVFTAATQLYAKTVVDYLNQRKKTIRGVFSRNQCMETCHGLRVKDLRIIINRSLKDIVIVDNLVHSFGLQIENGIPILDFIDNKNDVELLGLEQLLLDVAEAPDVRVVLREKLRLRSILRIAESYFLDVESK